MLHIIQVKVEIFFFICNDLSMNDKKGEIIEKNSFNADLRGHIGPKWSKAVQHDSVECYLLPRQVRKSTAARL